MRKIFGKKKIMTQIFGDKGQVIPVTLIEVGNNTAVFQKTTLLGASKAFQMAYGSRRRVNKAIAGQVKDLNLKPKKLYELTTDKELKAGDIIGLDTFKEEEIVFLTGISKGKGFAGTVKRHHFNTGPKTHGSNNYRQPGSIGDTGPQRVVKGKRMAGHMGHAQVTVPSVKIVKIDTDKNLLYVKGPVPGPINSEVLIWSKNEN